MRKAGIFVEDAYKCVKYKQKMTAVLITIEDAYDGVV